MVLAVASQADDMIVNVTTANMAGATSDEMVNEMDSTMVGTVVGVTDRAIGTLAVIDLMKPGPARF